MNSAAVIGRTPTEPGLRVWQRSDLRTGSSWVLVDDAPAVLRHDSPGDLAIRRTSHRHRGRRVQTNRRRGRADRPSWLWLIRWYRARWAARRALRSR